MRVATTPQAVILRRREGRERDLERHRRERESARESARESHSNTAGDVVSSGAVSVRDKFGHGARK